MVWWMLIWLVGWMCWMYVSGSMLVLKFLGISAKKQLFIRDFFFCVIFWSACVLCLNSIKHFVVQTSFFLFCLSADALIVSINDHWRFIPPGDGLVVCPALFVCSGFLHCSCNLRFFPLTLGCENNPNWFRYHSSVWRQQPSQGRDTQLLFNNFARLHLLHLLSVWLFSNIQIILMELELVEHSSSGGSKRWLVCGFLPSWWVPGLCRSAPFTTFSGPNEPWRLHQIINFSSRSPPHLSICSELLAYRFHSSGKIQGMKL